MCYVAAELQHEVAEKKDGVAAGEANAGQKQDCYQDAKEDEGPPAPPAEAGAVADSADYRLEEHGQYKPGKGKQPQVGVLLRFGNEVQHPDGQDDAMHGLRQSSEGKKQDGNLEVVGGDKAGFAGYVALHSGLKHSRVKPTGQ